MRLSRDNHLGARYTTMFKTRAEARNTSNQASLRRADAPIFFVSQNRLFPRFVMLATFRLFGSSTGHPLSLIPHLFRFNIPSIARYAPSDTLKPLHAVRMWLLPPTIGVAKSRLPEKKASQNPATRNTVLQGTTTNATNFMQVPMICRMECATC